MSKQRRSRTFQLGGPVGRGHALGEIYFPTNGSSLGADDLIVVNAIAMAVRAHAIRKRVELVANGFTDHRGSKSYNQALGQKRAKVVQRKLASLLDRSPNISTVSAVSHGESSARQGTGDFDELASDRRVVVWDRIPEFWREPAKKPQIEKVPRLTYIRLHKFDGSVAVQHPNVRPGHETTAKLVQYAADYLTGGVYDEYGDPTKTTYTPMDGSFRVSDVYIHVKTKSKIGFMADTVETDTEIRYIWGPPKPYVVIRKSVFAQSSDRSRSEREVVSRRDADKDPFTFPIEQIRLGSTD